MLKHKLKHRDQSLFKCDKCFLTFPSQQILDNHNNFKHDHPESQMKCPYCEKTTYSKRNLEKHIESHDKTFYCKICNRKLKNKNSYYFHVKSHSLEKLFKCDICDKSFKFKTALQIHLDSHSEGKYTCPVCDEKLRYKY